MAARMNAIVLQTEHLTKRYGDKTAVDDLSLDICAGEIFGFLGPNGAGKTTSVNMICGLLKPDSGRVLLNGKPLGDGDGWRGRVGVCPQEIVVWEKLTCLEQLQFMGEMYGLASKKACQNGESLLAALDLSERRDWLAAKLSGGMRRRLSLALALVHNPEILLLDEPEAGLDPQSRVLVREYIQSLAHKKTVILTTHDMDEAERLADRVAIIDHGHLLVQDTPQALKRRLGCGDVIEISLADLPEQSIESLLAGVIEPSGINVDGNLLTLRTLDGTAKLPAILDRLASAESASGVNDVRLRQNTLEDVFIQLTGRRLRE
jgi:ABC-2 type transport system ATP-binding protein